MAFGDKWRFFDTFGGLVILMLKSFMYASRYMGFRAPETPNFLVFNILFGRCHLSSHKKFFSEKGAQRDSDAPENTSFNSKNIALSKEKN